MKKGIFNQFLIFAFGLALLASSAFGQQSRYLAVLGDGRRVTGDKLTGWHAFGGTVRLDNTVVQAPGRPLLWMRDSTLQPWRSRQSWKSKDWRGGYIEFVGGDRIVGSVYGGKGASERNGKYVPAHLVFKPTSPMHLPVYQKDVDGNVRILPDIIKRIVLRMGSWHRYQPGTVFYRDGRRVSFVDIRWSAESVVLLLKAGTRTTPISDIAEVHMPRRDQWEAYYRQLAVLSPDLRTRLIRLETTDGLIATSSKAREAAAPFDSDKARKIAARQREHLDRRIKSLDAGEPKSRQDMASAQAEYDKNAAELNATIKSNRAAYDKTMTELKPRLEKQQRDQTAGFAKRRKKLQDACAKDLVEIEKRLAQTPEAQREQKRRSELEAKKRSYERAVKSLDAEERKAEAKRRDAPEMSGRDMRANLRNIERARVKLNSEKEKLGRAAEQRSQHVKQLESYKAMRDRMSGPDGAPATWRHMIQPVWSLDPLWIPFKTIRMRWSFAPTEFPLSRIAPTEAVSPAAMSWRADRSEGGGFLRSGGRLHGWGFGVHAYSELTFALPPAAVSFHSRLGLDHIVGERGCVRGKIYLGSTKNKPVYESPLLIGSGKTAETGVIRIPESPEGRGELILQADPAVRNHPPRADPLNIRDKLDWLEPELILDPVRLAGEVQRHIAPQVLAWRQWRAKFDKRGVYTWGSFRDNVPGIGPERFLPVVGARVQALTLSREMTIRGGDKWLVVDVGYPDGSDLDARAVTLRIGDEDITPEKIPIRQYWRLPAPLVFSIEKYRRKEVKLLLTQRADGKKLYWRGLSMSRRPPGAYQLVLSLKAMGKTDMQVSRGLGLDLQLGRSRNGNSAIELERLGGVLNFYNHLPSRNNFVHIDRYLHGAIVGCDWIGGEKTFAPLKDMHWLRYVIISRDSTISEKATRVLWAARARALRVHRVDRTPSTRYGIRYSLTMRNRGARDVVVFRIDGNGQFLGYREIKPGAEVKTASREGYRYEAHLVTTDYRKSKPVSRCLVKGGTVWEIK